MKKVRIGLVGFGTIGTGVAKILLHKTEEIRDKTGVTLELAKICDKDTTTDRGMELPAGILTSNLADILDDPTIEIVVELVGGLEPARSFVLSFLEAGKNVVTANKALLAHHGAELVARARGLGRTIAFEASVCGGIPILASIGTSLTPNRLDSLSAIVNGTCNFILTAMEEKGTNYADALKEAQRLGYAEANPALDVNGSDAAQKLAILAELAFGADVDWKGIPRTGIDGIEGVDIDFARKLSRRIRLLATAQRTETGLELKVAPTLVPETSPLAQVRGAFNAVEIVGDFVGPVFYQGLGAGEKPTASAVCADVIDMAIGRAKLTFDALQLWSPARKPMAIKSSDTTTERAFLRIHVTDRPGVLAEIAGALGRSGVSIASMYQSADSENLDSACLMILTHEGLDGALQKAIGEIDRLGFVLRPTVRLSVRD